MISGRWVERIRSTFGGVDSAPVVPSPSPDDLRDVCRSFNAHTATGSDNLHPALHLKRV